MTSQHHTRPAGQQSPAGRPAASARATTRTLHTVTDDAGQVTSQVRRTTLPSGLRIVTERMAGVRSVAVGVFVGVGSRHETPTLHGCSHFLEHLLFKGTGERSALDISVALDAVGGEFNAYTAKEYTCYHARVLDEDLPVAIDVLGDMLTSSLLLAPDVEAEREVILDEIAMHDDDPDDLVHNLLAQQAWGDTPIGRPIAGTAASIAALSRDQVARFWQRHYRPERMVVAVSGNVEHRDVVARVRKAFERGDFLAGTAEPALVELKDTPARVHPGHVRVRRSFEQVSLVLAQRGPTRADHRRFALGVLTTALGGGPSSRLFQEVRERRGLAYSVYSFGVHHADSGLVGVAAGCLPAKRDAVLDVVRRELASLAERGLSAEELERGKGQLRGGLVLGLEDTGSRMVRLGKGELFHRETLPIDEVLARIDAVTLDEVGELASELFGQPEVLAEVAP